MAPANIVYLTKRINISNDTSLLGIPEGTKLVVLSRANGRIAGQADRMVIEVAEADTTIDLDRVAEILAKRSKMEAATAKFSDPLNHLDTGEVKPRSPEELRKARVEALKQIQQLNTSIEVATKQISELSATKAETAGKYLLATQKKTKKNLMMPKADDGAAADAQIANLKEAIEGWQKQMAELRASVGLAP